MKNNSVIGKRASLHLFIRFFFALVAVLFLNYCTEEKPTEQTEVKSKISLSKNNSTAKINFSVTSDSTKKDSTKDKDTTKNKDGTIIEPYAQSSCQKDVDYWIFERYENVPGKIVGIWPTWERWGNVQRLKQLKDTLGFNYMFTTLGWPYDNVVAAGYTTSNIVGGGLDVVTGGYSEAVQSRPTLWGYYTDEPITNHGYPAGMQMMELASNWFRTYYPNSKFMSGETTVTNADYIDHTVDVIFCTRYDGYPDWYNPDQRTLWTNFRNQFGTKFSMTWIGAHKDLSQYEDLIGHATNLGLQAIWLYQELDPTDDYSNNNVETFVHYAWRWGWLRQVQRKWIYTYKCINQNPCDCDPYTLGGEWILVSKYKTWETRVIDY